MTSGDRAVDEPVTWNGSARTVRAIQDLLIPHTSEGMLRLVLQQLTLREDGREVGTHEVIDAVTDVGGNLVSIPIRDAVRADPAVSTSLDAALARLRANIAAELGVEVDSLEVILTAGARPVARYTVSVELSPAELGRRPAPSAVYDGAHQIAHHAHELDELRDHLAEPPSSPVRRAWDAVLESLTGRRPSRP